MHFGSVRCQLSVLIALALFGITPIIGCSGGARSVPAHPPSATSETTALPATPSSTAVPLRGDDPRPKVPELTDAQRDDVRTIVANDARFIALTAAVIPGIRTTLAPAEVVPWQDEHQNMLGGVLTVELPGPQTIAGEWLAMA